MMENSTSNRSLLEYTDIRMLRSICIPVLACVGFIANTLVIAVFLSRKMKSSSCSVFITALAFIDNLFLANLLIYWFDDGVFNILTSNALCSIAVFVTYVTGFLSVMLVCAFTCKRCLAICFPFKSSYLFSVIRDKTAVLLMTAAAVLLYSFSFWTTTVLDLGDRKLCTFKHNFILYLKVMTWIDTVLTLIVPFILITGMNAVLIATVVGKSPCDRNKCYPTVANKDSISLYPPLVSMSNSVNSFQEKRLKNKRRVIKSLVGVSTTFIVLNFPWHLIRLYQLISESSSEHNGSIGSIQFFFTHECFQILYFASFSCNSLLYTMSGNNFKQSLQLLLKRRPSIRRRRNAIQYDTINSGMPIASV